MAWPFNMRRGYYYSGTFRQNHGPHKRGGGVLLYVNNIYKACVIEKWSSVSETTFQQLWLKVQCKKFESFLLCTVCSHRFLKKLKRNICRLFTKWLKGSTVGLPWPGYPFLPVWKAFTSTRNEMHASDTSRNPLQSCLMFHSIHNIFLKTSLCANVSWPYYIN